MWVEIIAFVASIPSTLAAARDWIGEFVDLLLFSVWTRMMKQ